MKVKRIFILLLAVIFIAGMFFSACNEEPVNAEVSPVVDNNVNYLVSQTLNDVFLDLGESEVEGNLHWKDGDAILTKGENEYEWVFEPKNSKKYLGSTGVVSVVAYKPLENLNVSVEDWTFGEKAKSPVVENNSGNGEVAFEYAVLGDEFYFIKEPTDAGNYIVKAVVQTTSDYARKEVVTAFSIEKKSLQADMVGAISNEIYTGSSLKPEIIIEGLSGEENFVACWTFRKSEGEEFGELVDDFVSAGTYKAVISGKGNYTGEVEKSFQIFETAAEYQTNADVVSAKADKESAKTENNEESAKTAEKTATTYEESAGTENVDKAETAEKVEENTDEKTATTENVDKAETAEEKEKTENNEESAKTDEEVVKTNEEAAKTDNAEKVEDIETAEKADEKMTGTETELTNADEKVSDEKVTENDEILEENVVDEKATETELTNVDEKEISAELTNAEEKTIEEKASIIQETSSAENNAKKDLENKIEEAKTDLENKIEEAKNDLEKSTEKAKIELEKSTEKEKTDLANSTEEAKTDLKNSTDENVEIAENSAENSEIKDKNENTKMEDKELENATIVEDDNLENAAKVEDKELEKATKVEDKKLKMQQNWKMKT